MKQLFIDLLNKGDIEVSLNAVTIHDLNGCMLYAKRASRVIVHARPSREVLNYLIAFDLSDIEYHFIDSKVNIFSGKRAIAHVSECVAYNAERFALEELSRKTWQLIISQNIPARVYEDIDSYIPFDMLSMYDIQLSQQLLPVTKMSTYKPTDLQRKEWSIADENFMFSKERASTKFVYTTTLYDKLLAYLQLKFYKEHGIEPLYTHKDVEVAELITPYSAVSEQNAYERACY